jgi:hypothetical protein
LRGVCSLIVDEIKIRHKLRKEHRLLERRRVTVMEIRMSKIVNDVSDITEIKRGSIGVK